MIPEEYEEGRELEDYSNKNELRVKSTYLFKSNSERFFGENTNMTYVDKPYYDFIINRKSNEELDFSQIIKVEVLSTRANQKINGGVPFITFKILKGEWRKSYGADFIVSTTEEKIYFGAVKEINDYLQKTMTKNIRERSLSVTGRKRHNTQIRRSPREMEKIGLLKSLSKSEIYKLEELIIREYNKLNE